MDPQHLPEGYIGAQWEKNYTETNSMVEYYDICILEGRVNDAKQKHLHQQSSHKQQPLRQSLIQRHNITPS